MPKFREMAGVDQNKNLLSIIVEICPYIAMDRQIWSDYGWKSSKTTEVFLGWGGGTSCILYQFRSGVQTYGHRPRYTDDNDAAETGVWTQQCQDAASKIGAIRSSSESIGDV